MPALWMMDANDTTSSVLDLHHLRYELFRHSKDYFPCGMPEGYEAEANATLEQFRTWKQAFAEHTTPKPAARRQR